MIKFESDSKHRKVCSTHILGWCGQLFQKRKDYVKIKGDFRNTQVLFVILGTILAFLVTDLEFF